MNVELRNLTKIFPSRNKKANEEVVAVNNFSFTILKTTRNKIETVNVRVVRK